METPDLFQYTNFRTYLADFVAAKKGTRKGWSYAAWARKLGVKSPATLAMILNGQRNPGPELTNALCRFFAFGEKEKTYFRDLVELEKHQANPALTVLFLEKLSKQHPKSRFRVLGHDEFRAISHWHYYAIREMVLLKDFRPDPEWISKKLNGAITPPKARDTLKSLLDLGLLAVDERGQYALGDVHLDTATDLVDEGLKRFHEQMLAKASQALRQVPVEKREVSGTTFSVSLANVPRAKELIREFRMKLCKLLEQPGGDAVYQLEMAFFPLTTTADVGENDAQNERNSETGAKPDPTNRYRH